MAFALHKAKLWFFLWHFIWTTSNKWFLSIEPEEVSSEHCQVHLPPPKWTYFLNGCLALYIKLSCISQKTRSMTLGFFFFLYSLVGSSTCLNIPSSSLCFLYKASLFFLEWGLLLCSLLLGILISLSVLSFYSLSLWLSFVLQLNSCFSCHLPRHR